MLERVGYERTDLYAAAASWGLSPSDFQFTGSVEDASEEEIMGAMNSFGVEVDDG